MTDNLHEELADLRARVAELEKGRDDAKESAEFTRQWYAVRIRRLDDWVRENRAGIPAEIVNEFFSIRANGTASPVEPQTYAAQMNVLKHRAEFAEQRIAELKDQGRNACELFDHLKTAQKQLNESNRKLAQTTAALKLNKELRARAEQLNGELVAALRDANASVQNALPNIGAWENQCPICGEHVDCGDFIHKPNCAAVTLPAALARAESATPAEHQDSERLDWLSEGGFAMLLIGPDETIRDAIDAARKQEGAKP